MGQYREKEVNNGNLYWKRIWYSNPKPYIHVSSYTYYQAAVLVNPRGVSALDFLRPVSSFPVGVRSTAIDSAVEKFYSKINNVSTWANNLAERKKTIAMVANRTRQLVQFVKALKKLDFKKCSKILGVKTPKGVSRKKQLSNNFLEYHFGWTPLIHDIGNSVETLQNPLPKRRIHSRGAASAQYGDFPPPNPSWGSSANHSYLYQLNVRCGGIVTMTNPDLYLANQMGFTNPASILWEAIPFSFVADWFLPIGKFLESMTATLGVSIEGWTSVRGYCRHTYAETFGPDPNGPYLTSDGFSVHCDRGGLLGPGPSSFAPSIGFSPMRAVTGVSLLIQQLKSIK